MQRNETYHRNQDGIKIFYLKEIPTNPKALLLVHHGFRGHYGQYRHFIRFLTQHGFGVYMFDCRGHGRSQEETGHLERYEHFVDDLQEMVTLARSEHPGIPLFTYGHSMGGLVTFIYGILFADSVDGQIFAAPALGSPWGTDWIPGWAYRFVKKRLPKLRIYPVMQRQTTKNKEFARELKQDRYVINHATCSLIFEFVYRGIGWAEKNAGLYQLPCLFLHGTADKIIPLRHSEKMFTAVASEEAAFITYPGLHHELLQEPERETVMQDILSWLETKTVTLSRKPKNLS